MTREEIEDYLEGLVKKGHARVVGLTESGKKQYAMTEEGLFDGEPNVEYALLVKVKERRVIMAVKHPIDAPVESEDAAPSILLCGSEAHSKMDAVEIWNFVLPFDQRDIDFGAYTFGEGFDPDQIELACRGAGLWQEWEATFERVAAKEKLQPRHVHVARDFFDRFGKCK
jgi:hypothetical protein